MSKQAISVTLREDNLVWLRGHSRSARHRSVSETLDRLIAEARAGGRPETSVRSVKGTVHILAADPSLARADATIRTLFRTTPRRDQEFRKKRGGARRRSRRHGG